MNDRMTNLEIRLTHQEATIDTLNDTVIQQQRMIEQLSQGLIAVNARLAAAGMNEIAPQAEETPPPHY